MKQPRLKAETLRPISESVNFNTLAVLVLNLKQNLGCPLKILVIDYLELIYTIQRAL